VRRPLGAPAFWPAAAASGVENARGGSLAPYPLPHSNKERPPASQANFVRHRSAAPPESRPEGRRTQCAW